ncbi:MAG TPA: helix-turn-helix domain-containing protein [Xanthobacteraceae bacterium]|nr:helix-turn-helix domain-containing protein [Xanthobacteraceae bacterium]
MRTALPHVSKSEAARRIGVSRRTIYDMLADGRLPVDSDGRIPRKAFDRFLALLRGVVS